MKSDTRLPKLLKRSGSFGVLALASAAILPSAAFAQAACSPTSGDDSCTVDVVDGTTVDLLAGNDSISGAGVSGTATIGDTGAGVLRGGDGSDTISLSGAYTYDSYTYTGSYNRTVIGNSAGSSGQVLGDSGNDSISLDFAVVGGSGAGTVSGGDGDDTISVANAYIGDVAGGTGQILGDAGNDSISISGASLGNSGAGTVSGGDGNDTISLTGVSLGGSTGSTGQVLGDAGADSITLSGAFMGGGNVLVSGGSGNDTVSMVNGLLFSGTTTVSGGADSDTLDWNVSALAGTNLVPTDFETLIKRGNGTLSLTGASTFSAETRVEGGTLNLTGGGTVNSALVNVNGGTLFTDGSAFAAGSTVNIANGATLTLDESGRPRQETKSDGVFAPGPTDETVGTVNNAGTLNIRGGNLIATTSFTNTGTTNIAATRTLDAAIASINGGTVINSGTLQTANGTTVAAAGTLTSTGTVAGGLTNAGTVNASGALNGAVSNSGTLTVTGALTGNGAVTNSGTLNVSGGSLTGLASLTNSGTASISATRTLQATSASLTGGTLTNAGTLQTTNGTTVASGATMTSTGTVSGGVTNSGTVNAAGTVSGAASNAGTFNVTGALAGDGAVTNTGTFNLSGGDFSGSSTFANSGTLNLNAGRTLSTGAFSMSGGSLINNGTIIGGFTQTGGTVSGNGTVQGALTMNSGTLTPGNSIGTVNVNGNLNLNAGSSLVMEVTNGSADRINVTGGVAINGATLTLRDLVGGTTPLDGSATYILISNDGTDAITGSGFASVIDQLAFVNPTISLTGGDGNDVAASFAIPNIDLKVAALNTPQLGVSNAFNPVVNNGTAAGQQYFDAFLLLSNASAAAALQTLSGEAHPVVQDRAGAEAIGFARNAGAHCDVTDEDNWCVTARIESRSGDTNADTFGGSDVDGTDEAFFAAISKSVTPNLRLGAALRSADTETDIGPRERATGDNTGFALFGGYESGPARFDVTLGRVSGDVAVVRGIVVGTLSQTARASYDVDTDFGRAEASYGFGVGAGELRPFLAATLANVETGAFTEAGAGAANLRSAGDEYKSSEADLGATYAFKPTSGLTSTFGLAYNRLLQKTRPQQTLGFDAGGTAFTAFGAEHDRDRLRANLDLSGTIGGVTLFVGYQGLYGSNDSDQSLAAGVRLGF